MSSNSDAETSNHSLRVDQDTETNLEALFDSVFKPDSRRPLQLPLRMRKLPESFFNPPSTGSKSPSVSHSRENSADSAFGASPNPAPAAPPAAAPPASPLQVNHPRAHSSPASLQQTYNAQQQAQAQAQARQAAHIIHMKARSFDLTAVDELGPLPQGWEQAQTAEGQVYFLK